MSLPYLGIYHVLTIFRKSNALIFIILHCQYIRIYAGYRTDTFLSVLAHLFGSTAVLFQSVQGKQMLQEHFCRYFFQIFFNNFFGQFLFDKCFFFLK